MKCSTRKCKREATGRIPVFVSLHSWKLKPYCEECLAKIALKPKPRTLIHAPLCPPPRREMHIKKEDLNKPTLEVRIEWNYKGDEYGILDYAAGKKAATELLRRMKRRFDYWWRRENK